MFEPGAEAALLARILRGGVRSRLLDFLDPRSSL